MPYSCKLNNVAVFLCRYLKQNHTVNECSPLNCERMRKHQNYLYHITNTEKESLMFSGIGHCAVL
jgi:hypothetical protein